MKTFLTIIFNYNPAAMYDSYEDSTRGPPHGPSRVHLKKKGRRERGNAAIPPGTAGRRRCDVEPLGVSGGEGTKGPLSFPCRESTLDGLTTTTTTDTKYTKF